MKIRPVALIVVSIGMVGVVSTTFSHGICIPSPIKATRVEGRILWKPNGMPMSGVHVELLTFDHQMRQLAEITTDTDGRFALMPKKSGKYYLRAKSEQLGSLTVELQFEQKTKIRDPEHINFLLDLIPDKACSGSSVAVVRE